MNLTQGEIYWVAFPTSEGREQAGRRPALIIQTDSFNQSLPTVCVIPITSNLPAASFAGTIRIEPDEHNGLTVPSVLLCDFPRTRLTSTIAASPITKTTDEPRLGL